MPAQPEKAAGPVATDNAASAKRRRTRRWLLLGVALLYVFSVPWYREADPSPPLWLGLPNWVTTALLCYAGAAVLNALAWARTPIDDAERVEIGGQQGGQR